MPVPKIGYVIYKLKRGEGGLLFRHFLEAIYTEEDLVVEKLKDPNIFYTEITLEEDDDNSI